MKLNLIYYKNVLDIIVSRFINDYNDCFTKINDCYVLSTSIDRTSLKKYIKLALKNFIAEIRTIYASKHDKLIVIGACYPVNNILLSLNSAEFPSNLQQILLEKPDIKYVLKESDILIDIEMFNSIAIEIFNEIFSSESNKKKLFDAESNNIIFISHNHLDCYMVFKSIKWIFGQSNCVNIWKNKLNAPCEHIIAVNDLISRYANNKRQLNSNKTFKQYAHEIKEYLNTVLGTTNG